MRSSLHQASAFPLFVKELLIYTFVKGEKRYDSPMRLNMFGIISLMVSSIFIWIYVLDALWAIARHVVA